MKLKERERLVPNLFAEAIGILYARQGRAGLDAFRESGSGLLRQSITSLV